MNSKKCIVLDLDNTLWGGIVGEDGLEGIKLSLSHPGASFIAFQQGLLDLHNRGIILALNSRNNLADAMQVIRSHPNMILKEHHFAAMRINWNDKVSNLVELARELNIGLDSIVFLDDDSTNRASVRAMLPEVETPDLPTNPVEYPRFLRSLTYFSSAAITDEDKMRGNMYVTERLRKEVEKEFPDREEFLKNLGLELHFNINDLSSTARLAQMTEKTNQFNLNKQILSEQEIESLIKDPNSKIFQGRLTDRFGDYGITNLAIGTNRKDSWHLDQFLMSCRVIGRGIEEAFLSAVVKSIREFGGSQLSISFIKTEKNKPAQEFVKKYFNSTIVPVNELMHAPNWITVINGKIQ